MPRRVLEGTVTSDKMDKTITVRVERRYMHPVYKKYIRKSTKYAAHDENGTFSIGDKVQIIECSPISKRKRWTVLVDGVEPAPVAKEAAPKAAAAPKKETAAKKAAPKKTAKAK